MRNNRHTTHGCSCTTGPTYIVAPHMSSWPASLCTPVADAPTTQRAGSGTRGWTVDGMTAYGFVCGTCRKLTQTGPWTESGPSAGRRGPLMCRQNGHGSPCSLTQFGSQARRSRYAGCPPSFAPAVNTKPSATWNSIHASDKSIAIPAHIVAHRPRGVPAEQGTSGHARSGVTSLVIFQNWPRSREAARAAAAGGQSAKNRAAGCQWVDPSAARYEPPPGPGTVRSGSSRMTSSCARPGRGSMADRKTIRLTGRRAATTGIARPPREWADQHEVFGGVGERFDCHFGVLRCTGIWVLARQVDGQDAVTQDLQQVCQLLPAPRAVVGAVDQPECCHRRARVTLRPGVVGEPLPVHHYTRIPASDVCVDALISDAVFICTSLSWKSAHGLFYDGTIAAALARLWRSAIDRRTGRQVLITHGQPAWTPKPHRPLRLGASATPARGDKCRCKEEFRGLAGLVRTPLASRC